MVRSLLIAAVSLISLTSAAAIAEDIAVGVRVYWKDGAKAMIGSKEVSADVVPWPATVKEVLKDWVLLGPAWVHKKDVRTADEAIEFYTKEIAREPTAERFRRRAAIWRSKEKFDTAIEDYTRAIQIDPKDKHSYNSRATARYATKNYALAIQDFTGALEIDPKFLLPLLGRGTAFAEVGDFDGALKDYSQVLDINPNIVDIYLQRGVILARKGDFAAAIKDFNTLKQLSPRSPDSYNAVAWILATCPVDNIRNGSTAVEQATRSCELTEWKVAAYLDTLAAAYAETGDFKKAEEFISKAIELGATEAEKQDYGTRLALYKSGKPFRDTSPN